jgi:hypothetical protein
MIGSLIIDKEQTESMVKITLFPSDLVSYWSRCGLTADFGATFYSFCFPENKTVRNSLSFILNEIVENAVKYSVEEKSPIKICLYEQTNDLVFEVQNFISDEQSDNFSEYIHHLQSVPDLNEEYMNTVKKNIDSEEASGLGILTILNDFQLTMAFDFSKQDSKYGKSVFVQVQIMQGELNAEN